MDKLEYPNIREYLSEKEIDSFSKEELSALDTLLTKKPNKNLEVYESQKESLVKHMKGIHRNSPGYSLDFINLLNKFDNYGTLLEVCETLSASIDGWEDKDERLMHFITYLNKNMNDINKVISSVESVWDVKQTTFLILRIISEKPNKLEYFLENVGYSSHRMSSLVSKHLSLNNIVPGMILADMYDIDLPEVLEDVSEYDIDHDPMNLMELVKDYAKEKNIDIHTVFEQKVM